MLGKWVAATLMASTMLLSSAGLAQSNDTAAAAQKGRVATEVFGKQPFMRDPSMSPDGTKIAVMASVNGIDNLGYIDLAAGGKAKYFVQAKEYKETGDRTVGTWRWAGNRTIIFSLLSREDIYGQRVDLRRLVAYDLESGKLTPLAWDGASGDAGEVLHVDHKKETILLQRGAFRNDQRAFNPEVIEVSVRTGVSKIVMRPNIEVDDWISDGDGTVRASTGGDASGKMRVMYRSDDNGPLKTVSNDKDPTFTQSQIVPDVFLKEPDMAIVSSNKDGIRKIYKVNMKTMEIVGNALFEVPGYDVDGPLANKAGDAIIGVAYTDNRPRIKWFDPRLAEIQKFFDEDFGPGNAQIKSANEDYTKIVLFIGKPNAPGGYYIYNTESGKLQLFSWYHPVLKDVALNPTETVRYKASDGLEMEAVLTYPRHRAARKNLPVVVMPHGGPYGVRDQEEFGFYPWHQAMAELGYVVIQPNYRGSGGYGKEFVKEGRKPDGYGNRMQDDLNDAVSWFAKTGLVDPKRACIMGWSYGGYASARGAQRDPGVWKCAIAGAGVYDFPMMKSYDTNVFGAFGASFQATASDLVGISSARNTDGPWAPILIVAGVRDQRIPIEQSRTLVSRLKSSGKKEGVDFRYVEQPKGTHNLPYEDVHIQWLVEAGKWLDRFNPAYIPDDADKPVPVTLTADIK